MFALLRKRNKSRGLKAPRSFSSHLFASCEPLYPSSHCKYESCGTDVFHARFHPTLLPQRATVRGLGSATAHVACPRRYAKIAHGAIRVSDRVTLGALLAPSWPAEPILPRTERTRLYRNTPTHSLTNPREFGQGLGSTWNRSSHGLRKLSKRAKSCESICVSQ